MPPDKRPKVVFSSLLLTEPKKPKPDAPALLVKASELRAENFFKSSPATPAFFAALFKLLTAASKLVEPLSKDLTIPSIAYCNALAFETFIPPSEGVNVF